MSEYTSKETKENRKTPPSRSPLAWIGTFLVLLPVLGFFAVLIILLPMVVLDRVLDPEVYSEVVHIAKIAIPIAVIVLDISMLYKEYRDEKNGKRRKRRGSGSDDYPRTPYPHDGGNGGFGM